ncbi:hypothetical protein J6590_086801 [Homalodisca vitripennis]|nr:hypothetical protein J6590_086801 [Homalodisca vitripennis]
MIQLHHENKLSWILWPGDSCAGQAINNTEDQADIELLLSREVTRSLSKKDRINNDIRFLAEAHEELVALNDSKDRFSLRKSEETEVSIIVYIIRDHGKERLKCIQAKPLAWANYKLVPYQDRNILKRAKFTKRLNFETHCGANASTASPNSEPSSTTSRIHHRPEIADLGKHSLRECRYIKPTETSRMREECSGVVSEGTHARAPAKPSGCETVGSDMAEGGVIGEDAISSGIDDKT